MTGGNITVALNQANFENAIGGAGDDHLTGDGQANVLIGNGGVDELLGFGGNDALDGGTGNDVLEGGAGTDDVYVGRIRAGTLSDRSLCFFAVGDQLRKGAALNALQVAAALPAAATGR